jgi:outer membrane protein TolC
LGGEHLTLNGVPFSPVRYTSAALAFSTPILDGGRLEAAEAGQGARRDQADLAYQQVVLHAVQEVDSALAALHAERAHCEALLEARQQALSALARVLALQREGEIDRVGVLELERAALGAEAALLEAERSRGLAAVQMYGALGGGWSGTESTENSR